MAVITNIEATQVLDNRGNPTVHVDVTVEGGIKGGASVPSGASTGSHEALELRDGDPENFKGKGVTKAIANVNGQIAAQIVGLDSTEQKKIDEAMIGLDATPNKSHLGANAILGVSLAVAVASANEKKLSLYQYLNQISELGVRPTLPTPMFNIINGGAHANNNLSFQEFMIIPDHLKRFSDKLAFGVKFFGQLRELLEKKGMTTMTGDEGGYAPDCKDNEEAIEIVTEVQEEVHLGLDVAGQGPTNPEYWQKLVQKFPISYIEDPLGEDSWEGWKKLTEALKKERVLVVGDDLFVTNPERFQMGIDQKIANALIIKPNQIGTLTETFHVAKMAKAAGYTYIISHRSGETIDSFIADLTVAIAAPLIKAGAPSSQNPERMAKYNRLVEIEQELGF